MIIENDKKGIAIAMSGAFVEEEELEIEDLEQEEAEAAIKNNEIDNK
ncbi:MAG: hypothetical protein WC967_12615 [Balneolaceae bacterium]